VSSTSLGGATILPPTLPAPEGDAPVLAIPEGWVIDDLSRERLARQLARAPEHISGVVAETGPLPSGASYRVHAERLCLEPQSAAAEASRRAWPGAILVRPEVAFEVRDGIVKVDAGRLLVDPGAHAHDPWRPITALEDASPLGRPPFRRRPVVVFLACEPDVEALDWSRSLVNNLVRRDVEGRLAMFDIAEGLHLTQQCLPSEASIRSLCPDVIVALDETALDRAPAWCADSRSAVVIAYTPDVGTTYELVSWRLGRAQGRLRALVGRRINAPSLVSLVNRLCSGPHPGPPTDAAVPSTATAVRAILTRKPAPIPAPASKRSVVVVTGSSELPAHHVLDGLVDHLVGAGHTAEVCPVPRAGTSDARGADVVVIASPAKAVDVSELIGDRRLSGRPTVVNLEPPDASTSTWSQHTGLELTRDAATLTESCSSVTTSSSAMHALFLSRHLRTHLLPPLLTRERVTELRSVRGGRSRTSEPVVGWTVGGPGSPKPDYTEAVADGVLTLLSERPRLSVEIVGESSGVPARVLEHARVHAVAGRPGVEDLTRWTTHLWTPPIHDNGVAESTLPLVEGGAAGVPIVLPALIRTAVGGYPDPGFLVDGLDRAGPWIDALRLLLDDDEIRMRESRAAMRRFDTTHGPTAADVAVNRFLGWVLYQEARA
jgi:hypothetical protein